MKYYVRLGDETIEVDVRDDPTAPAGAFRVQVEDAIRLVDCRETAPNELSLRIDAEVETYLFEDHDGRVVVHDGMYAYPLVVEDEREHLEAEIFGREQEGRAGAVRSVMPGIVQQVLVSVGDAVEAGQALLIMEAMKMENEVRAEAAGKVSEVLVSEGDTVEADQLLLVVA